jgi:hypothetical protein
MPQLGPAFLHRPISGAHLSLLEDGAKWLASGMRAWTPRRLLETGWKPQALLCDYENDDAIAPLGVIEKSWAGETRLQKTKTPADALPLSIALAAPLFFETSVDLPESARSTLQKTIALRMSELSPIPPEEASFAIGDVQKKEKDRIAVKIALTRKSTLRAAGCAVNGARIAAIGAKPHTNGAFFYSFLDDGPKYQDRAKKWAVAVAALWISLFALLSALDVRANRALAAAEDYENALRQELKDLQDTKEKFARLSTFAAASMDFEEAFEEIAAQLSALPENVVITNVDLGAQSLNIAGFAPNESPINGEAVRRPAEAYRGYDRFNMTAPVKSAKDESAAS